MENSKDTISKLIVLQLEYFRLVKQEGAKMKEANKQFAKEIRQHINAQEAELIGLKIDERKVVVVPKKKKKRIEMDEDEDDSAVKDKEPVNEEQEENN